MRYTPLHRKAILLVVFVASCVAGTIAHKTESLSLTSTSVTLSNSRLSYRGQVDTGNTTGSSLLIVENSGNPSNGVTGMVEGDVLAIGVVSGTGNPANHSLLNYEVASTSSQTTFNLKSTLAAASTTQNFDVVATMSATLSARFTTASAVSGGSFRMLVPAVATVFNDNVPDQGGWDNNSRTTAHLTCPSDGGGYTFSGGTHEVNAGAVTIAGQLYHEYLCDYSGAGGVATSFQSNPMFISGIANPAPASGHTAGNADTYRIIIQNLDASDNVIDSTTVSVGVVEAVRVTAYVAPQLTFTISGIAASTSVCGAATSVATTATVVPLGELGISNFVTAAQNLLVSTNATNGYAVTAIANDQLGKDGQPCVGDPTANANCIPDSPGDDAAMTNANADDWSNTATKGFAYTLENDDATSIEFEYDSTVDSCAGGGDCYRQFADNEMQPAQPPRRLFYSSGVADSQDADVCYKAIISATQPAGFYENYVTYTATATF